MEDNDQEVVETPIEETQETSTEETLSDDASPEDYKEFWEKKVKTLEAQKDHWKKKATQATPNKQPDLKTNNEYLTRDEAVLLAQGYDENDIARLNVLAKAEGKKLSEVKDDEMFVAWKEKKDEKVRSEKAQLGSSKSSTTRTSKPVSEMTEDEHKAYWKSQQK